MSRRTPGRWPHLGITAARMVASLAALLLAASPLAAPRSLADDLGSARLLIAGTELTISPESQTVPFNTTTIVETDLTGYDPAQGVLPDDLRVLADFTGPEVDGILVLETRPGQPFRIPRLSLKGEYLLDNVRLVQGEELLAYARPRSAVVLVTQVLVTRVTSRALTLDEIRSYGIVVDEDDFSAFNFTFGFAVGGEVYDYNLPVIYHASTANPYELLVNGAPELGPGGGGFGTASPRFRPPQMAPFTLQLESSGSGSFGPLTGGCLSAFGCQENAEVRLPGVILFPTDVSLLHQYFSVVLMARNDAPAGDPLVIRDLTAKVTLPPGLRMAETEPPTPLGVPVPVRVPGPDGRVGTGDDLTFLVAQASGQAEVLVEGRKQGTHVVEFDLEGVLEGLPDGSLRRVTGQARGAVVVRDPTLGVTISHPATVRADEEYDLRLTVANTSNAPVNLVTLSLPASKLSGVQVVGESQVTVPSLPPGESEVVEFRLRPLRTGKVVASSSRSPHFVDPTFELTVGVGENGIPLSPDAIVLPRSAEELPAELVRQALGLAGLGFSLATAPAAALDSSLPRMELHQVDEKVYHLGQAGRHVQLGEETFDAVATLAAEWTGVRNEDWEWDRLRRTTDRGGKLGNAVAAVLAAEAQVTSPRAAFDRFAATTAFQGPSQGALAVGAGARLEVTSRTTGDRLSGDGLDSARRRELPFADLYDLAGAARMALLARPEEGGHQARLTVDGGGSADLHLLVPGSGGGLRRVSWTAVSLGAAGLAVVDFTAGDDVLTLFVDGDGDGLVDQQLAGSATALAPRPFTAMAAVQKETMITGHAVEVLFSADVDLASLLPLDPQRFQLPGNLSNGGMVPAEADLAAFNWTIAENKFAGLRSTRVVQVVFSNPVSPYVSHTLTVQDLASVTGEVLGSTALPVTTTVTDPGGIVEGTVVGPDGEPVPFARVELYEADMRWVDGECIRHRTAAVRSDAAGGFRFDYVRNGSCSDVYLLRGTDPQTGHSGEARGRVRFAGQVHELNVVMLGRGTVRGRVTYDDGTVPAQLDVVAHSPVFAMGVAARVFPDGSYEAREVPVGTVSLAATDRQGSYVFQTIEVPTAGAVVERDLVILRRSPQQATGDVRGTAYEADGISPAYNAYLALYVDGELVGVERSGLDGGFDFGTVPAGQAEIEAFDGETGLSGAQLYFEVLPDQVNAVDVLLRDERGVVEGHVYRQTAQGQVPVAGAVVWVGGTPFNTVTDAEGFYRLDGVFAGERQVYAADLERQEQTAAAVTVSDGLTAVRDLRFVEDFGEGGVVGEVLGFTGNPVPGAAVHIKGGVASWWHEAITDTRGRFSIPDLKPGTYELHAVQGSGDSAVGAVGVAHIRFPGETPFVSIRFKKGTIRGRTVALDQFGQKLGVTSLVTYRTTTVEEGLVTQSWEPTVIETDADGRFEIADVLAGAYSLSVTNAFHGDQTVRGELVFHGEEVEHEIVFQRNGSISGVVYDVDGETPVEGAVVYLRHPSFAEYDLVTDAEGRFRFDLLPPGGRFPIDVEVDQGALFRRGRVWVGYNRHGLDMEVEIVLPRQGTVSGWVEEASGQRVPGAVVTLSEHAHPRRRLVQTADGEGYYSFTNVFAGRVTVEAQAPALGGLGGKTVAQVTTEGEEVWTLIALEGTGEIAGTVFSPVDGEPAPSAQVTLYRWAGGVLDAVTADTDGGFRFRQLPIGLYRVWVFDPTTGRHGATDAVPVDFDGQLTEIAVELEVRGEVEGHLYDPDSGATVPGATVELVTDSLVHFKTYSSADADGWFEFLGIPEGDFTLRTAEPAGRRRASGGGGISEEGERVTVDLYLEATGSVTGTVWNPPGAPAGAFEGVNTVVREGGRVVGASLENPFTFDGLIVGRGLRLEAYEVAGDHRAVGSAVVSAQGEVVTVELTMEPIGAVAVTVSDSFGSPVAGADLLLASSGFYGRRNLHASTGADGRAQFADVGEGWLNAFVVNPVNGLKGSATAQLTLDGEQVEIAVQLEDAASLRGRLLLADGVTPAEEALVVVSVSGRQYQLRADANGDFELPSLPLGSFTLQGSEYFGDAAYIRRTGTLAVNGEVVDLGTLVLDDEDPEVVAHTPPSGAGDLPLSTAVTVHFNEPLDRGRFSTGWFRFRKLSGTSVSYTATWSDGDATVTLTPNAALANFTAYEVVVDAAYDLAGRGLKERVKTVFKTVDQQPPGVVDVLPRNGQVQVPVDTNLRITFSEPVELSSLSGTSLALVDTSTGQQVTTTWQLAAENRLATVTPQTALLTDRTYQLTVQGVRDKSGNTMTTPVVTTFNTPDTIAPTIGAVDFPAGTTFTSGDDVPVTVTASDASGVAEVRVHAGEWTFSDTSAPYDLTALAPVVAAAGDVALTIEALDVYGNAGSVGRTIQVAPHVNASAPSLTVTCGQPDHLVVPGVETELAFTAFDDQRLELLRLLVDGVEQDRVDLVLSPEGEASFLWTPPASAEPGDTFAVRLEARDFAGNVGVEDLTARVPTGTILVGARSLFDDYAGQDVVLAEGTFLAREPLNLASLTLVRGGGLTNGDGYEDLGLAVAGDLILHCGATLAPTARSTSGARLDLDVTGTLTVESTVTVELTGRGYAGGVGSVDGHAPDGVTPARPASAGGSHGGVGTDEPGTGYGGVPGDVYDSVYVPTLAGGGGAGWTSTSHGGYPGSAGGGVADLDVGELVLDGTISVRGGSCDQGAGGGGSLLVRAGTIRGSGLLDASGGDRINLSLSCSYGPGGGGGGGRVALYADVLDSFDPATQVLTAGGRSNFGAGYGAPGTLYVKQPGDAYGVLRIDQGMTNTEDVAVTELPALGSGPVSAFELAGGDAWVTGSAAFKPRWLGARMTLLDGAGTELGTFELVEIDAGGRVRLVGAGAVSGAVSFQGEYRFDRVVMRGGAGLVVSDPLVTPDLDLAEVRSLSGPLETTTLVLNPGTGPVVLDQGIQMENLTLRSGVVLTPPAGSGVLRLLLSGTLTVEAGAVLDLGGQGYAGGHSGHFDGYAPEGLVPARAGSGGGGHGGVGTEEPGSGYGGLPGEVYDSAYVPTLAGGGGAGVYLNSYTIYPGQAGGGVVDLVVGELVVDGTISVRGAGCSQGSGAGGTLLVRAGTMRGSGTLDASGGDRINSSLCTSTGPGGGGGGGRVALYVDLLDGFDPASQVLTTGGHGHWSVGYAAPGTLYVRQPGDTYGVLRIDQRQTNAETVKATELPALGSGSVSGFEPASPDAWVTAGEVFRPRWLGAWMTLLDAAGTELGTFEVLEIDADGRVLLGGAGTVGGPLSFRGEYLFDRVVLRGGAGLTVSDPLVTPDLDVEEVSSLSGPLETTTLVLGPGSGPTVLDESVQMENLTLRSGVVLVPQAGSGGALRLSLPGTLTVEAGAEVNARGAGYSTTSGVLAPSSVAVATQGSGGGSHGGTGTEYPGYGGQPGEVFDSIYLPMQAGGGGAGWRYSSSTFYHGGPGGGIIELEVGDLVLDGTISVQGDDSAHGGGAGGTLLVRTGTLSGTGLLDASGGARGSSSGGGSGGGGRVAIHGTLGAGFDPATQVRAVGGEGHWSVGYAAAGTVFLKQPGDAYGMLRIDQRLTNAAQVRATELPALGSAPIAGFEAESTDAWVTAGEVFRPRWLGAWMTLLDGAGGDLGTFEAIEIDAGGRVRLAGAGEVTGATGFRGEYRFDRVAVGGGAGLVVSDPLVAPALDLEDVGPLGGPLQTTTVVIDPGAGPMTLHDDLEAQDVTLRSGAVLASPAGSGGTLQLTVQGTLTVEAGAALDVSGTGYGASDGELAPPLVAPATVGSGGGSHGGRGTGIDWRGGEAGEVYGNLFEPLLAGGAGADSSAGTGERGGGAVDLNVGTLVLDGVITARGDSCSDGSGAGGSVRLHLGILRGAGSIDASGGDGDRSGCGAIVGAGGGGRVAIHADLLDGFDPATQVRVVGGEAGSTDAAAGTLYVRLAGDVFGSLRIDQEEGSAASVLVTELPGIGAGVVGIVEQDAGDPADLWIEPQDPAVQFGLGVTGAWLRVDGVDYAVIGEESRRRLLLAGAAGAVSVGDAYVGIYKFDDVEVSGSAGLQLADGLVVSGQTIVGEGSSLVYRDVDAPQVTVTAPTAGTLFASGDPVTITADVSDASAVTRVVFTFGEQTVTDTEAPWQADLPAPVVAVEGDLEIRAEATDSDGNVGVGTQTVRVQPLAPGDPPVVVFVLPTPGALLAPGTGLDVTVTATHDDGIEKVDFLLGDDPTVLATDTAAPYTFRFTAPAGAADGDVVTFRARARSFSGDTAEATYAATVVAGSVVQADTFLAAGDLSLEDTSVVVAAGTLTVEGPHTFRDLVVLDGAAVTHPTITAGGQGGLDLGVTRDVYVAANGSLDASGRGWTAGLGRSPAGGEGLLSSEDFSGDLSAWQVVDDTTYQGPSNWHIYSGYLKMTSNIHEPGGVVGTHVYRKDGFGLGDHRLAFRLDSGDDDGIGVMFRYQDADNYYRLLMHRAAAYRRLEKRVDGVFTTLAEDGVAYGMNRWYEMEVVADGPHLDVWMDGQLILSAEDDTFTAGTYGFATVGNAGSYFDDVRVVTLGGAAPAAGGSHGGRGAGFAGSGRFVGSPFDPTDPGAGGGSRLGTAGGGVVRLAAGGEVVIDGALRAAGATTGGSGPFGAGGSVRLDAAAIRGAGVIDASGGGDGTARAAGGGGRVALYAATVEPGILSRTVAAGGEASTALTGGAGTVFVRRDAQPLGDLILDNAGRATDAWTELLSTPAGTVDVVGVDILTDAAASFPHSLHGTEVALNGDTSTLWTVLEHADGGDTLTLDVAATPLDAVPGDGYELRYRFDSVTVRGGARGLSLAAVQSTTAPDVETGSVWNPAYAPSLGFSAPADGAIATSGSPVTFTVEVDDVLGVDAVTLEFDGTTHVDDAAPFSWTITAPIVASSTVYPATLAATDRAGHQLGGAITLTVSPSSDPTPPQVTLGAIPADGDVVLAGVALGLPFTVTDVEQLYAWRVKVDGAVVEESVGIDVTQYDGAVGWAPLASAAAGTVYSVVVEAQDYGGNLATAQRSVRLPLGPALSGDQIVDGSYDGQHLTLGAGTFTVTAPLNVASLTVTDGAVVTSPEGGVLRVDTPGEVRVQLGGVIDVTARGYAGGSGASSPGTAPAGVEPSLLDSGGSHGGGGYWWDDPDSSGEVYDSVVLPQLAGGGGSNRNNGKTGGAGGGVIDLAVGELILDGALLANGQQVASLGNGEASGAGGTVLVQAGVLRGGGSIRADGGEYRHRYSGAGPGGGGRVALHVTALDGFDPATQAQALPGLWRNYHGTARHHAAAGTVYVRSGASTYGDLRVDSGTFSTSVPLAPQPTTLPSLGSDAVTTTEVSGSDLWVTGPAVFQTRWLGAWMVLLDATGGELGSHEVVELDGGGRARLAGAGAVGGVASYRGEYRFDTVVVDHGAGLEISDPLIASDFLADDASVLSGPVETTFLEVDSSTWKTLWSNELRPANLTIRSGAVVRPLPGGVLRLEIPGTLHVEAGATLDVSATGYTGGVGASAPGAAPSWVEPSLLDSGGSHGGAGYWWTDADSSGEVYDSVYLPQLAGGGGSNRNNGKTGGAGGGVIDLTVGELILDGALLANGQQVASLGNGEASGAGGTVLVQAGVLRGSGSIRADGGEYRYRYSGAGPGGGGRVALHVTTLDGFDPATQAQALPGLWRDYHGTARHHAAVGTVYVRTATSTYGDLRVDSGTFSTSVPLAPQPTTLPSLGSDAVTTTEVSGSDLWLTGPAGFQTRWLGAWMVLLDATGGELGSHEVVELDGGGRTRLAGAGAVGGVASYRGEYRFDTVVVNHGAGLEISDPLIASDFQAVDTSSLTGPIEVPHLDLGAGTRTTRWGSDLRPNDLTIRSGAVLRPLSGGLLRMEVPGTVTVESGATLDVSLLGHPGGVGASAPGGAPAGVDPSVLDGGGSHGGAGRWWDNADSSGEVYDSIYLPELAGGGGSNRHNGKTAGAGGGVVDLQVGELILDGTIVANGQQVASLGNGESSGAGGTVFVQAGVLSGTGSMQANGGEYRYRYSGGGPGGGGRVALHVTALSGFDPTTQTQVRGGLWRDYNGNPYHYAAPGTLFVQDGAATYGDLYVLQDKGTQTILNTRAPAVGTGIIGTTEVDSDAPADLWIEPQDAGQTFALGITGAWVRVNGADYRILEQSANRRRVLLDGAAGIVSTGDSFAGVYKFDSVTVHGGTVLEFLDTTEPVTTDVDADSQLITP